MIGPRLTFWPDNPGRDGARAPIPWGRDLPHAGFSTATETWLPIKPTQAARSVASQVGDPDSVLAFYKRMIALRRSRPSLRTDGMTFLDLPPALPGFRRGADIVCIFNMEASPVEIPFGIIGEMVLSQNFEIRDDSLQFGGNGFAIMAK